MTEQADFTVAEISAALRDLRALSPEARAAGAYVYVDEHVSDRMAYFSLYPFGISAAGDKARFNASGSGATFREALAACIADFEAKRINFDASRVSELALAVMTATFDTGACSTAALRARGFAETEIELLGAAATKRANAIADGGPFSIVDVAGNGAPDNDESADDDE